MYKIIYSNDYLAHHGILGQKWGKRNGPPYPLDAEARTADAKEKQHARIVKTGEKYRDKPHHESQYSDKKNAVSLKAAGHKTMAKIYEINEKAYSKSNSTLASMNRAAKEEALKKAQKAQNEANKKAENRNKSSSEKLTKSPDKERKGMFEKQREKYINQYVEQGISKEDAIKYADKKIKTDKILLAVGGVALTAIAVNGARKYIQKNNDTVIKAGKYLQRIEDHDGKDLYDVIYASHGSHDNARYANLFAGQINQGRYDDKYEAYTKKLLAGSDIKIASQKTAKRIFEEARNKDSNFKSLTDGLGNYESFNRYLADKEISDFAKPFYDLLKEQGYGAIRDVNDWKYSGFNAHDPLIIFDTSSITVDKVDKNTAGMGKQALEYAKIAMETTYTKAAAVAGAGTALKYIDNDKKKDGKK